MDQGHLCSCWAAGAATTSQREECFMYRLFGLILAGGVLLGHAGAARAQVALSLGNPYSGTSLSIGSPGYGYGGGYGYGYPGNGYSSFYGGNNYPAYATTTYSSGYAGYVAPATTYFNS